MKSFKVSNFRLIDRRGCEVEFSPITVLTGANSSGKSSYIKALKLFGEFLQGLIDEYRRVGRFDPIKHELDFSNPDLKLGGFTTTFNNTAAPDESMSFSLKVSPQISCYGDYEVTYSFNSGEGVNDLNHGFLKAITVARKDEVILHAHNEGGSLTIDYFNNNTFFADFLTFCEYCYIPYCIFEGSYDQFGGYDDEYYDEKGEFSIEKASKTKEGSRLAKLQNNDFVNFYYKKVVDELPHGAFQKYKSLLQSDLLDAVETCLETNIAFYFPVLELFKGKTKDESIEVLKTKAKNSSSLSVIQTNGDKWFKEDLETVINAYSESEFDSFIDYYRSLENYVLENVNPSSFTPGRWGESYNFIDDHILHRISVSYDSNGFWKRDKEECLFSTVYSVLSRWEWAIGEEKDKEWMYNNFDGRAINSGLWANSDNYIKRDIDCESRYYHSRHVLYDAYLDFVKYLLTECLIPTDLSRLQYYTSSFTQIQRLHSFEENSHFVKIIKKYLHDKAYLLNHQDAFKYLVGKEEKYIPDTFLNKWLSGVDLSICKSLEFDLPKDLGFSISLINEGPKIDLADAGHGITQMISILLQIESVLIENEILDIERAKKQEKKRPLTPIIGIEEPEVSLHPCFQSFLADILYDASANYPNPIQFIVETHSEYMIRKMQAIVSGFSKDEFENNPFAVYYFNEDGTIKDLGFKESGRFKESFGPGFFDEAAKSKYLLRMNESQNNE